MKKSILVPIVIAAFVLTGCASGSGAANGDSSNGSSATAEEAPPAEPLDLSGEWKQTNSNSADSYQAATISGDVITINWVNDAESTSALYWVGTYEAPTEDTDTYTWTSAGDVAQMDNAIMASQDDSKDFTYEDGKLMYELTALGVTMTVEMEKQ
jgi:predicted small secreted protein